MARLGHPDGELCLVKGAAHHQIGYAVSMASSVAPTVLMNCARELRGVLYYQLYVKKKRAQAEAIIKEAKELGFRALLVTVDTPVVGRREEDDRYRMEQGILSIDSVASSLTCNTDDDGRNDEDMVVPRGPYSSALDWDDLAWIQDAWGDRGPICLKGIATAEDAKIAAEAGIKSIYLSNHGGRQLDGSPSSLRTLLEIREYCPEVLEQCEVLLDGGVRRGSDVVKALCLGARAVGLGRPFLYALSAYGTPGVIKAIQSKTTWNCFILTR
jgi:L-lactate dehydrogenase (cytochrome)